MTSHSSSRPDSTNTVTAIVTARRRPGRPKVVRPPPQADELQYIAAVSAERDRAIDSDALHHLLKDGKPDTIDTVWATIQGLAEEQAALRWDREHAEGSGGDAQKIATRRVEALSRMASLILGAKKMGLVDLDHTSSAMEKVEQLWMSIINDIALEVLPTEQCTHFLARLRGVMGGWRDRV